MSPFRFVLVTALMLSSAVAVHAQSSNFVTGTKPRASSGGIADNEMRGIYRDDVGQGFTSSSLNQISLQNARAQVGYFGQSSAVRQSPSPSGARLPTLSPSRTAKPFSSVSSSPTVSPYLNLFREDLDGSGDFNYQTLVRPQFQQLATNQQFQRQSNEISQRVQAISAQSAFGNPAGSESQYPTGHQTAFGYYSRFYPGMPQPGKR
ncbi:MAG: hypothetical protein AB7G28_03145 [Pirellulales bacterium]